MGLNNTYEEYVAKFGKDNADYLMEVLGGWQQHYKRGGHRYGRRGYLRDAGAGRGGCEPPRLVVDRVAGDLVLVKRLVDGDWDGDYLIMQPGEQLRTTCDEKIIGCGIARPVSQEMVITDNPEPTLWPVSRYATCVDLYLVKAQLTGKVA